MGILDEAIREHLDLKRQHGAEDSEVKQLEDEAFGPPTRPGEPDFPESQEQPALGGDEAELEAEDVTALLDTTPAAQPPAEPEPVEPPSDSGLPVEPEPIEQPASEPLAAEPAPAESDSVEEPPSGVSPTGDPGPFYDQASQAELEVDELDLELDEEPEGEPEGGEEPAAPEAAPPPEPAQPISDEHPIETLETVEHPMEDLLADEAGVELPEAPETGEEAAPDEGEEAAPDEGEEPPSEDDDVLEGTPEFLRDQPEDDELWFEQGEPKDFDF